MFSFYLWWWWWWECALKSHQVKFIYFRSTSYGLYRRRKKNNNNIKSQEKESKYLKNNEYVSIGNMKKKQKGKIYSIIIVYNIPYGFSLQCLGKTNNKKLQLTLNTHTHIKRNDKNENENYGIFMIISVYFHLRL